MKKISKISINKKNTDYPKSKVFGKRSVPKTVKLGITGVNESIMLS
jgi:hypothetical protein